MSPSKLVMLAFRLALTRMDPGKGLRNSLSVRQIRDLAGKQEAKVEIDRIYEHLEEIMRTIDTWLAVFDKDDRERDGMPAFIRTSIARRSPDVFLLLMYLAAMDMDGEMAITPEEIRAAALILHWFGLDKRQAAETVFSHISKGCDAQSLRQGLAECLGRNLALPLYSPEEMEGFIKIEKNDPKWTPWSLDGYAPWGDFYDRMSSWERNYTAQEMLLYAQRSYINTNFPLYDPAREDMWEEHNRPWDYDHIIPRNWVSERGRPRAIYRDFCNHWIGRIGNIAAIPFEDNRSKGDKDAYDVYEKNVEGLLFYPEFHNVTRLGASLPDSPEGSIEFAQLSLKRTLDIYGKSYELLSPLLRELCLTDRQMRRKRMMEKLASKLDGSEFVYVARCGSLWRDYPVERDADWTREWVSVGVRRKGKYFVSFTWGCNDQDHLEIGIRKLPGTDTLKDHSDLPTVDSSYWTGTGEWWYAEKGLSSESEEKAILTELENLNALFKDT